MSQSDPAYFEKQKEALNNFLQNNKNSNEGFSDRNIFEIRDRLGRISEESLAERNRDPNHQNTQNPQRWFIENCLNFIVYVLTHVEPQTNRNVKFIIRAATVELLQKKILLQHMTQPVVDQLTIVLEKDNENNAATAIRIMNDLLKNNQQQSHQYQRSNSIFTDALLLKLYNFFEQRIEFLVKFNLELKKSNYKKLIGDNQINPFHDQSYVLQSENDDRREKDIRLNIHSLSFVTNIPPFFIYTIFVLDSIVRDETKTLMREVLKKALKTMNQVINETNFQELLQKVPRNIVQELFNAYSKFLQLLALAIKKDDSQVQSQTKIIKDLSDTVKLDQVVATTIKTLKHCPVDIMHIRIDISNRLKQAMTQKRDPVQPNEIQDKINEINANVVELIDEETIVGKNLKIPPFQKTSIYQNWLDIVKHVLQSYLPKSDQSTQQITNLEKMQTDFINNQIYMEKIFNTIFKVLFDSSLQLVIHEKALELIKIFLEVFGKQPTYFVDKNLLQFYVDQPQQQQNDSIFKEVTTHSPKYKLLDKLFQMIGMKLNQIRKQIQQMKEMLIRTKRWGIAKKTTPQTNIASIPSNTQALNENYISQLEQYVLESDIDIEQNLITQQDQAATQVYTYDDEEEYQVNSISINTYTQYVEFAKDLKSKIFDQLNDILQKLLQFVTTTNKEIVNKQKSRTNNTIPQRVTPLMQVTNENKPYLSNLQCHYMSKIMKNGLMIFDELHDHQRNHFDILEYKRKTIVQFMQFFIQFQDPINFKNIFEPNSKLILKISVNLIKTCPESHCLPQLLQDHLQILSPQPDPPNPPHKQSIKFYIEFLLNLYLKELQTTPELPSKFGYCRGGKLLNNQIQQKDQDEYISLIQKLLRIPIRLFPRFKCQQNEEPIVKPLLKQLILFFVKKSHETYYPIDFLGLLLSLVKRIQNTDQGEGLSKYFQQLCDKYDRNEKQSRQQYELYHRLNLSGVNIVLNMFELFQTGIVEIQDIVAEVIANFPLQKTTQINLAKQYPIFAQCLFRALHNISTIENQVIQKTLMILENIVTNLSMEELREFFGDLLQPFIEKLLTFPSEYKMADIYQKNVNLFLDPSFKSLKILSKLGSLVRKSEWPIEVKRNHNDNPFKRNQYLEVQIEGLQSSLKINLTETVRCAVEILQNVLEQQLATYLFKQSSIQHSYSIVKQVLLGYYQMPIQFDYDLYNYQIPDGMALDMKLQSRECDQNELIYQDDELISAVTKVFIGLSNFHNIIQTITTATFHKIKEDVENVVTTLSEMYFIQLADDHCVKIEKINYAKPDINSLYAMTEQMVQNYLIEKPQSIRWISYLFRGLNKRYMLTAEENMNFKDFYIQQHEFIWNKLLMGNCLKKYKKIMESHMSNHQNLKWAYDVYYSVVIRLFEEFVYEKFGKQTQLQKEDDRRRKIMIVQSYGGTMIPSEGLNCRSISIELLTEIQNLLPRFEDYYTSSQITGLPYIPDQRIIECSFILLRQLPETIKVISQQLTKNLLNQTLRQLIKNLSFDHSKFEHSHQSSLLLQEKLRCFVKIITQNCYTYKRSLLQICTDLFDTIIAQHFNENAAQLFYMNIGDDMNLNHEEKVEQFTLENLLPIIGDGPSFWVNIEFSEIMNSEYTRNTVLKELIIIIKQLCEEQKMSDIVAQKYANGYRILTYLLQKYGQNKQGQYHLFKLVIFNKEPQLESGIEEYIMRSYKIIQQNEEQYSRHSKLILHSEESQTTSINVSHGLDDLEFKINIEDIDFEIKWQSQMVVAIFGFLKKIATINYIFTIQKYFQRSIDKNTQTKPIILSMKYKTVEILYEGLLRVEQSIRQSAYKYLQELVQQDGISNDKTLFENDDRLKKVMKPLLTCVQQEIFYYVPSFLKSLKLILKIFSKVFHRALSDKLQGHLQKIVQDNSQQFQNATQMCTFMEWSFQLQQSQESLNFQMGIVSGLLKLFQHLTQQLTNPQNGPSNINIVQRIIQDTNALRRNYIFKVSQYQLNQSIDKPLVKFLNTLAANHFDVFQSSFSVSQIQQFQKQLESVSQLLSNQMPIKSLQDQLRERLQYIKTIRQVISEPTAYPLREKLCREKQQLAQKMERFNKTIEELSSSLENGLLNNQIQPTSEQLQSFHQSSVQKVINVISEIKIEIVQFGFQLFKHNPSCLKRNTQILENYILKNIKDLLERQKTNNQNKIIQNNQLQFAYNQLILSNQQINSLLNRHCSMLKQYINQNEDSKLAIQGMLKLILYSTQDKVKKWVMNVAMNKSIQLRKRIIEIWMDNFNYVEDESANQVQMTIGYHVIYPILFYSNQRNDLAQISQLQLFQRINKINEDLVKQYSKILHDIEHHAPMNFSYKLSNGLSTKLSDVNLYYKSSVIDMLQISQYLICFQEQQLPQDLKMSYLQFGYEMMNKSDKLVAFYANLYFSKYLKKNQLFQNDPQSVNKRIIRIYTRAIKQLDESGQSEQELYSLCKKIISVVLPWLDEFDVHEQKDWIQATSQLLKQEQNSLDQESAQKVSRFWSMFVKNHKIFHKHHESFTIHIINSMQQIGFYNSNPPSAVTLSPNSYQNYRRIALDMAFLQVEWKTKLIKSEIQQRSKKFKESFYQSEPQHHDEALSSEIYQSFFIKQSLKAHNIEDSELSKRALYLLKKILMIAPLTNQKLNIETVKKNIANPLNQLIELSQSNQNQRSFQQQPTALPYFRYFMIVLNILMIIAEFQQPQKIPQLFQPYFDIIFHLNLLPDQITQQMAPRPNTARIPPTQSRPVNSVSKLTYQPTSIDRSQLHQNALTQDYVPLVFGIYCIFRKLLNVAKEYQSEQSEQFQINLSNWVKDAIQGHPQLRRNTSQPLYMGQRIPNQQVKVNVLSIFLLKLFFNHDIYYVRSLMPALKRIAEILIDYLKSKDKGEQYLDNIRKYTIPKKQFNIREKNNHKINASKQYTHSDLTQYIADFAEITDDFPFGIKKSDEMLYFPEDFPENQKTKFHMYRSALQKTIKMMAYNFDEIKDQKEQLEFLQLLVQIIESVPDYELKLECISILRLLFINGINNKEGYLLAISQYLSPVRSFQVRSELIKMDQNLQFKPSKMPFEIQLNFFFDISRLQNLFDKKIDQRSSDNYDNNHGKIQDLKVIKLYFMFLCELLLVYPFKKQQGSINSGFYLLKNIFDKGYGSLREFRRILQVISKLSTCLDYLQFFYKMILDIYGYTYDRFLQILLGDQNSKQQDQPLQTEGEEIMLMAIKFLILGRGQFKQPTQFQPQQPNKIIVRLVNENEDSNMREQVLNKYLAIYYRKNQWLKLYNSSIKLVTSEYLPSIVIYNLSYIPIQDQPQQPLRECIIPSAAIELMGTAANVSSRLLRPLFNQIITNDLKTITQLTEYLQQQSLSYGTLTTISNYLVQDILSQIQNIHSVLENQQVQLNFNNLITCLRQKNQLPLIQYLLEQIFEYLCVDYDQYSLLNEDIIVQLQGVYQEQWNKQSLLGCKSLTATQPWVKQLVLMNQLREPAQQYQSILNNQEQVDQFWYQLEQETHEAQGIQKEYDQQIIHQLFTESLQQLNQWNTLKQVDVSKVQSVQNKIIMGFRERQRDQTDLGWKDLNILQEIKQNSLQNDLYCYHQAYFKLLDFVRDDSQQNQHARSGNHVLQSIEQNLKYAQIINCHNFIKTLPKLTQSYDQMMSSPQLWGYKFLNFVSQFQLYTELEESLRQYATSVPVYPNQQQSPQDNLLDQITSGYQSSLLCKKYLFERQPTIIDQQEFTFDLISQRMIQLQMGLQRFNNHLHQYVNGQQQLQLNVVLDTKSFQLPILDYKTLLYPMRYYYQNGIFELFDEQTILKEVPKPLLVYAETLYQLEKIKYKTIKIQDINQNCQSLTELLKDYTTMQFGTYSSDEFKNYMINKIRRYKMINQFYKLYKFDQQQFDNQINNNNMQIEEPKLDQMSIQTNDQFINNQINQFKFWRDAQKIYRLAHKKYNNNIWFAQNYILVTSISIQYKPQKYPINGMYMFHILNITNPTEPIVIDAFSQTISAIPLHLLQRFLIQLISTFLKSPSDQVSKDCLDAINKLCKYNPLNNLQVIPYFKSFGIINDCRAQQFIDNFQYSSKLGSKIANIYSLSYLFNNKYDSSTWDTLEELIYLCGKVLDQKYYEQNTVNINEKCLNIINLIQKYHQTKDHFKQFFPVNDLQKWIKNDQLKAITSIYIASLKLIYGKLFGLQINSSQEFSQQLSHFLNTLIPKQIQITQLYALNDEFLMNQIPMLGQDGSFKKNQIVENIYITSMFPTVNIMFQRRKRLIRQIALLGNDEKKYFFLLKNKKMENQRSIQNIMDEYISFQFLKITNLLNQNYKETKIRNIKHYQTEKYLLENEKQLYQLEPYQEETYNLSNVSDLIISYNYYNSNNQDSNIRIPYYMDKCENYIQKQDLSNYILKFSKTIDTYLLLRKTIITNIGVQYALSFCMASSQSPKQLENLQLNLSNGSFYQKKQLFKVNNQKLVLYDPFAIRYSRNFEYLIGEINLNGYLIPAFTATIIGILNPDLAEYLNVLFWQLECKESIDPFIKKLKDIVYENDMIDSKCDRLIAISKSLFGGQEKLKQWAKRWF